MTNRTQCQVYIRDNRPVHPIPSKNEAACAMNKKAESTKFSRRQPTWNE